MRIIKIIDCYQEEKEKYIKEYGVHFNEKLYVFAVSNMTKGGKSIVPFTKDKVDEILKSANVTLEHNQGWDYMYIAAMVVADFWGSSITNDIQMARYIKDVIDDTDGYDGIVLTRWCADMCKKNINIDWTIML